MDFSLTDEQEILKNNVKNFVEKELFDYAKGLEEKDIPPSKEIIKKFSDLGLLGVNIPKKYGGLGMSHLDAVIVLEEIAKVSCALAFPVFESSFGPVLVLNFGSEKMCKIILPEVCSGDIVISISMSEPNAGSALTDLKTKLICRDGRYYLNGTKGGVREQAADVYLVYCKMSDEIGSKGIGSHNLQDQKVFFWKTRNLMGFRGVPSEYVF